VLSEGQGRLAALLGRLAAEPERAWSVAAMASEAALSPRSLLRRFRETTGMPPGGWLAARRVAVGQRLLAATRLPVEEVARQSGFGSAEAFRVQFRAHTGLAPRGWRERFG
jgi:AraC family transcriptional regulator, transcriptional activator FtrA